MAKRKKTDIVQFNVRLREELRKQLEVSAKAEKRSLNSEIVARLEQSFVSQLVSQDSFAVLTDIREKLNTLSSRFEARASGEPSDLSPPAPGAKASGEVPPAVRLRIEQNLLDRMAYIARAYDDIEQHGGHLAPAERDRLRTLADRAASHAFGEESGRATNKSESAEPELPMPQPRQSRGVKS